MIVSFYMHNIPDSVVMAQRRLLKRFAPANVTIKQIRTRQSHADALTHFVEKTPYRTLVILDIDCVPTTAAALGGLISKAESGALVGSAQRSNHIQNNNHIYVAPSCMAFSAATYGALQPVSFKTTPRADVGEELSYAAEEKGLPIELSWPISSEDYIWDLVDSKKYGHGTAYDNGFWHAFQIRSKQHHVYFIRRCEEFERLDGAHPEIGSAALLRRDNPPLREAL